MNILVRTSGGRIVVRPDTTWEKDNESLYVPDFVDSLSWTPVLVARICKPGRSVSRKFASRYYNNIGIGALLYPDNLLNLGCEEAFACASCLDHSSFIPTPDAESGSGLSISFEGGDANGLSCSYSGSLGPEALKEMVECAIEEATRYCYIRIGDFIAVELDGRQPFCRRESGTSHLKGSINGRLTVDFTVIP